MAGTVSSHSWMCNAGSSPVDDPLARGLMCTTCLRRAMSRVPEAYLEVKTRIRARWLRRDGHIFATLSPPADGLRRLPGPCRRPGRR
ncbi:hypothetical protein GCM10010214_04550 [Streptomyces abikoensis]|nr:hypothetical protein GCM10010214_04550 [Streptomyces abikoensis]